MYLLPCARIKLTTGIVESVSNYSLKSILTQNQHYNEGASNFILAILFPHVLPPRPGDSVAVRPYLLVEPLEHLDKS